MGEINNPDGVTYYIASGPGVIHEGFTEPGQFTTSGQPGFETATQENEYLALLATVSANFNPLPPAGTQLHAGEIYSWGLIVVMVRQDCISTGHDPDTVPALFIIHRTDNRIEWIYPEQVYKGTQRTFNGVLYEALQKHVTQSDWAPEITVDTLWKVVEEQGGGGTTWIGTGATVTQLVGAGVYRVSMDLTGGLTAGQAIKLGDAETVFTGFWSGFGDYLLISPHVTATNGSKVWKWA